MTNVEPLKRQVYPVPEAAHQLGIGTRMLWSLIAAGDIDTITIGRRRLVPHDAITEYIDRRTRAL